MRLIDADALDIWGAMCDGYDCNVPKAIEEAPTIEPKTKVIAQVTFDEDKLREIVHEAVEQVKEEYDIVDRPKGEWREERNWRNASFYSVCSECGYFDDERDDLTAYNFCPYCGSDNRGDDNAD